MNSNSYKTSTREALPSQLLRITAVVALTTLSKSCLNLWVAKGIFPKPVALSSTLKVWRLSDLTEWIDKKFQEVDGALEDDQVLSSPVNRNKRRLK